jgi:DNA-binding transcriptional MerR regulator
MQEEYPVTSATEPVTPGNDVAMTIDELAARVGMTVRNVRAYASRGLLPAPRLRGRTGLYDDEHLSRLRLIRDMLAEGYTLAAVERLLAHVPAGVTGAGLALHRALLTPWLPEDPEVLDRAALEARAGAPLDDELLVLLAELGVVVPLADGTLEVRSPTLLRAGLQVVALGIPPAAVVAAQQRVAAHAAAAARIYVELFRDTVWREFADAGQPAADLARVQQAVERVQPVASQAMLATFRLAMSQAVDAALGEELAPD